MAQYSKKDYWNERYDNDNSPFEWFQTYTELRPIIRKHIKRDASVLHVGCGSSEVGVMMYRDGWKEIVNIDFSGSIIHTLEERYKNMPGLQFTEMNAEHMTFETDSFDSVIDKACIDSLLCAESPAKHVEKIIAQISRVLKPGGVFLMVSNGKSEYRKKLLEKSEYDWFVVVESIPLVKPPVSNLPVDEDTSFYYVYICQKNLDEKNVESS